MIRQELQEMIDYFIEKQMKVHVKLSSGKFYNGLVVENETEAVIIFNDRVLGLIHIFKSQIDKIEEFH